MTARELVRRLAVAGSVLRHGVERPSPPAAPAVVAIGDLRDIVRWALAAARFAEDWVDITTSEELALAQDAIAVARELRAMDWEVVERHGWPG